MCIKRIIQDENCLYNLVTMQNNESIKLFRMAIFVKYRLVLAILLWGACLKGGLFEGKMNYRSHTRETLKTLHSHTGRKI